MRIFDINIFNQRVISSMKIPTVIDYGGPLSGDKLKEPRTFLSNERHSNTTASDLSKVWSISLEQARMTLNATTQHHSRSAIMPLSRRYRMDCMFEPLRLRSQMSTDTMDPRCDGLHGMRQCQVFGNRNMFAAAYPIKSGKAADIDEALKGFIQDFRAPESMISDGAKAQTSYK